MNNLDMAGSYLRQAMERVRHAEEALTNGNYRTLLGNARRQLN